MYIYFFISGSDKNITSHIAPSYILGYLLTDTVCLRYRLRLKPLSVNVMTKNLFSLYGHFEFKMLTCKIPFGMAF